MRACWRPTTTTPAAERLKIRGKRVQQTYAGASRRCSLEALRRLIRLTALFDYRARSLKAALHPVLLQLYLYYAVVRGGIPSQSDG